MSRYAAFVLFLALGIEIHLSRGIEVSVKDKDGKLCLYANLMVNLSVSYEVTGNKNETAEIELPNDAKFDGSTCGEMSSVLLLSFGKEHSWSMNFSGSDKMYQVDSIMFSYNLGDSTYFPNSSSNETVNVTVKPHISNIGMDTCYLCNSKDMIQSDSVNQTLWNVLIQAFVSNGSKSENNTICSADLPATTVAPTTPTTTSTAGPNTTTTAPPTTTIPTTTPTPTLPPPITGNYSIKSDVNSTACLLASFGLRIGFKQGDKYQEMNLDPNGTVATGSCGDNSSELVLTSNTMTIMLTFANDSKKFRLHALNITAKPSSGVVFIGANSNLSLWEAAVGSSYMCNKEQNYTINSLLSIFTYNLQVQPFGVKKGVFSTAEDCQGDAESFLVPIAVGVALLVLILIVLLAYFIGRKRNMASGYESF